MQFQQSTIRGQSLAPGKLEGSAPPSRELKLTTMRSRNVHCRKVYMGNLYYGANRLDVPFDDRVLAHLQIVMTAKLRRSEAFVLSWTNPVSAGSGRQMIWITPSTDLHFKFSGNKPPAINRAWLEDMAVVANTASGLFVTDEGKLEPIVVPPV